MADLKGIWDYTDDELRGNLSSEKGQTLLHVEIAGATVGEWDDGRPHLDLSTAVVCGAYAGRKAPRVQLSLGESSGTTKDGSRQFNISAEDAWTRLVRFVRTVHPEPLGGFEKPFGDKESLEPLGNALTGLQFVVAITRDGDFDRIQRSYALGKAPKGFMCECTQKGFSL